MHVQAEFNDGKSALTHPVLCGFLGEMLEVRSSGGDKLAVWSLGDIRAEAPGKTPLRLRHASNPGERLVVRDEAAVALFKEWLAPVFARRRAGTRARWILGTASVWLLLALFWVAAPYAVNRVADMIPYGWERTMGEETRDTVGHYLSGTYGGDAPWLDSGPGYEALQAMVARLEAADKKPAYSFDVSVLDADLVNAFALPGGFIVVTTGLIRQCGTQDELAGVLAHEMAHVTERHSTRRLVGDHFFAFVLKLLTGGGDIAAIAGSAGKALVSSKFSREAEREADILGVRRLALAGINPEGIALFFEKLPKKEAEGSRFGYLDSHPRMQDRQEYMRQEAARFPGPFAPPLSEAEWRSLKRHAVKKSGKQG